jgi:hypothetical protein
MSPDSEAFTQFMRLAFFRSPNFVSGSSGWTINQDGTAEFNSVTIRNGQIVSGTALYYSSSPPTKATLIFSISTSASADSFGNPVPAGAASYATSGGNSLVVNLLSTANSAFFQYAAPSGGVQGALILAVSSADGNDPVDGTAYSAGQYGINPAFGTVINVAGALIQMATAVIPLQEIIEIFSAADNAHNPFLRLDAPEQGHSGHLQMLMQGSSPDGTRPGQLLLGPVATGGQLSPSSQATLELQGGAAQPVMQAIADAATTQAYDSKVAGDTSNRLNIRADGLMAWGPGNAATDCQLARTAANLLKITTADLDIGTLGHGLRIAEGANGRAGTAVLVAGTVTVANNTITANTRVDYCRAASGGALGHLSSTQVAGTSFTINSSSNTDTSTINWWLREPG